jgi:hypothetical protein
LLPISAFCIAETLGDSVDSPMLDTLDVISTLPEIDIFKEIAARLILLVFDVIIAFCIVSTLGVSLDKTILLAIAPISTLHIAEISEAIEFKFKFATLLVILLVPEIIDCKVLKVKLPIPDVILILLVVKMLDVTVDNVNAIALAVMPTFVSTETLGLKSDRALFELLTGIIGVNSYAPKSGAVPTKSSPISVPIFIN